MANDRTISSLTHGLPANSLVGNLKPGTGPARPVSVADVAAAVVQTGQVASPGAPANLTAIADKRVLGNGSGASAAPVALSIAQPSAGLTVSWGAATITLALADDLSAVEGLGGTGLAARTAASTWTTRSLAAPAAGFTISNNDGVSGNPTFALADDLAALEGMAGTGLVARTAANTYAQRTITGTADKITVTNGDGVSGNPTLTISATYAGQNTIVTLGTIATGTWQATKIGLAYGGTNADASGWAAGTIPFIASGALDDANFVWTGSSRPTSTTTTGAAIGSNYTTTDNEVDFWNTVNNASGFYYYQKTGASSEQLLGALYGDATFAEWDLYQGSNYGFLYINATEVGFGAQGLPFKLFTGSGFLSVELPTTSGLQLHGSTSGSILIKTPAVAGSNTLTLPAGTTDFSSTGGASQVVKQTSAGGAFTVGQLAASDLSNGTTGSGAIVLANTPTLITPNIGAATGTSLALTGGVITATSLGSSLADQIYDHDVICTSQLDKTNNTFADVTGLTLTLVAGKTYVIEGWLSVTSGAAGGLKVRLNVGGGLTATSVRINALAFNGTTIVSSTTVTGAATTLVAANAVFTDVYIKGSIVVNAGGTYRIQAAQNTTDATTTSVFAGSTLGIRRIN